MVAYPAIYVNLENHVTNVIDLVIVPVVILNSDSDNDLFGTGTSKPKCNTKDTVTNNKTTTNKNLASIPPPKQTGTGNFGMVPSFVQNKDKELIQRRQRLYMPSTSS